LTIFKNGVYLIYINKLMALTNVSNFPKLISAMKKIIYSFNIYMSNRPLHIATNPKKGGLEDKWERRPIGSLV